MHPTMPRALRRATQSKKGYPSFTYTTPTAEADQVDLLAATPHYKPKRGQCGFQNATRTYQGGFQCEK